MSYTDDTQWIGTFSLAVTSGSNKVFSNGRHQVEITVGVTAQDGEDITDEQLESIQLVTLNEDGNYQPLSGEFQLSTERDERFDYYADTDFTADLEALESASLRKTFYVSSTRPGGSEDTLYAVISKDDETRYVSHSSAFDASVTVESVAPLSLGRDDFQLWETGVADRALKEATIGCDVYYLGFKDPQLKIAASIPRGAGEGTAYFQNHLDISPDSDPDDEKNSGATLYQNFYHYAYKVGEEKQFTIQNTTIPLNEVPGLMNFIRLKTTSQHAEADPRHEASRWEILDQYGNMYKIEMTQVNDGDGMDFEMYQER